LLVQRKRGRLTETVADDWSKLRHRGGVKPKRYKIFLKRPPADYESWMILRDDPARTITEKPSRTHAKPERIGPDGVDRDGARN